MGIPVTLKLPTTIDNLPPIISNFREHSWATVYKRKWIRTDNMQVSEVFADLSCLENDFLRLLCVRISCYLLALVQSAWKPLTNTHDFILWDRKELNTCRSCIKYAHRICRPTGSGSTRVFWHWPSEQKQICKSALMAPAVRHQSMASTYFNLLVKMSF